MKKRDYSDRIRWHHENVPRFWSGTSLSWVDYLPRVRLVNPRSNPLLSERLQFVLQQIKVWMFRLRQDKWKRQIITWKAEDGIISRMDMLSAAVNPQHKFWETKDNSASLAVTSSITGMSAVPLLGCGWPLSGGTIASGGGMVAIWNTSFFNTSIKKTST